MYCMYVLYVYMYVCYHQGALPKSIQKLPNGKLLVTYGDSHTDTQEEFDTVLAG